jgi:DeoR/GlpR family transcriptional regulator of sugar metabolism
VGREKPLKAERHLRIVGLLREKQVVSVEELSELLAVSPHTVRRDLNELDDEGALVRTQGGAYLNKMDNKLIPTHIRSMQYGEEKAAIAREALNLLDGLSTVILDAGSTTLAVARGLEPREAITVITNALPITNVLAEAPNVTVICTGGILLETTGSFIGPTTEGFFEQIHADLLFVGVRGVSVTGGITNQDMQETLVKRRMLSAARKVVVLADGTKLGQTALSKIADIDNSMSLITDWTAPDSELAALREAGLEITVSPRHDTTRPIR